MEPEFDGIEEMMDYLIQNEALELYGMTDEGEVTYRFNFEILKEKMSGLYDMIMEDINDSVLNLYKEGYVEMEYSENLEAKFKITEKGKKYLKNNKENLDFFGLE
jgi:hypothetical protein